MNNQEVDALIDPIPAHVKRETNVYKGFGRSTNDTPHVDHRRRRRRRNNEVWSTVYLAPYGILDT